MGLRPGEVYELRPHPAMDVGPWRDDAHPALVLAVSDDAVTVCPLTSSEQRGTVRAYSLEITEPVAGLTVPVWAAAPYLLTVSTSRFEKLKPRAQLPIEVLRKVRARIGGRLGIPTPPTT